MSNIFAMAATRVAAACVARGAAACAVLAAACGVAMAGTAEIGASVGLTRNVAITTTQNMNFGRVTRPARGANAYYRLTPRGTVVKTMGGPGVEVLDSGGQLGRFVISADEGQQVLLGWGQRNAGASATTLVRGITVRRGDGGGAALTSGAPVTIRGGSAGFTAFATLILRPAASADVAESSDALLITAQYQ